jgi:hypothetical protein
MAKEPCIASCSCSDREGGIGLSLGDRQAEEPCWPFIKSQFSQSFLSAEGEIRPVGNAMSKKDAAGMGIVIIDVRKVKVRIHFFDFVRQIHTVTGTDDWALWRVFLIDLYLDEVS